MAFENGWGGKTGGFRQRDFWVLLHRYTGLVTAVFLVLVGATGGMLAFNSELERIFAPRLFAKAPVGVAALDLATLAENAQRLVPNARLGGVAFTEADQVSAAFRPLKDPATGIPATLGFTQFYLDPWTGRELGRRTRGDLSEGVVNLMPFIYLLHFNMTLGESGQLILGLVALAWTVDCFVAVYLTFPNSTPRFWRRWRLAWRIKPGAGTYRFHFDLHRAGGLWLWPPLLVFAWSSVMMNIRFPVYDWVMNRLFDYESPRVAVAAMPKRANALPRLDWRAAQATGEKLIAELAAHYRFTVRQPLGLVYNERTGAYSYQVRGSQDLFERAHKGGSTVVVFDGDTGALIRLHRPTGERLGNSIESWLYALHMARVFGRPYQIFVSALGVLVALLSVTGVYIWWKKRRARLLSGKRRDRRQSGVDRADARVDV